MRQTSYPNGVLVGPQTWLYNVRTTPSSIKNIACKKNIDEIQLNEMSWFKKYKELETISHCIGESYEILEHLGEGGFAHIFKIMEIKSGRVWALKVLRNNCVNDQGYSKRFASEAHICAKLSHPGIVGVKEYAADADYAYMILEYIAGVSLKETRREGKPLQLKDARQFAVEILSAIGYMHENGIIHGDIKPGNILIDGATGRAMLIDFGLAHDLSVRTQGTPSENIMGSGAYMSPELVSGQPVGFGSDIYSFGIMLYEMVTGNVPFTGKTDEDVFHKHLHTSIKFPRSIHPPVPVALQKIIRKACTKDPLKRYRSVDEMIAALKALSL